MIYQRQNWEGGRKRSRRGGARERRPTERRSEGLERERERRARRGTPRSARALAVGVAPVITIINQNNTNKPSTENRKKGKREKK